MTLLRGIDVSNFQGADISNLLDVYKPQTVVVRLSTEDPVKWGTAISQLKQCQQRNIPTTGYLWCYWGDDPQGLVGASLELIEESKVPCPIIWLDCEDAVNVPAAKIDDWLSKAVESVERHGFTAGIYTGKYFWEANVADQAAFTRLPLWLAHYDQQANLDDTLLPVGAWTTLSGKQYTNKPIDQDVFDAMLFPPTPPPVEDPCGNLKIAVRAKLQEIEALLA